MFSSLKKCYWVSLDIQNQNYIWWGKLSVAKHILLLRDSLNIMTCVMNKPFAPVANMTTVHTIFVVSSVLQWHISQMNVKNVFLIGDRDKEVHMVIPLGVSHNKCVSWKRLYMVWNKFYQICLRTLLILLHILVSTLVIMIQL